MPAPADRKSISNVSSCLPILRANVIFFPKRDTNSGKKAFLCRYETRENTPININSTFGLPFRVQTIPREPQPTGAACADNDISQHISVLWFELRQRLALHHLRCGKHQPRHHRLPAKQHGVSGLRPYATQRTRCLHRQSRQHHPTCGGLPIRCRPLQQRLLQHPERTTHRPRTRHDSWFSHRRHDDLSADSVPHHFRRKQAGHFQLNFYIIQMNINRLYIICWYLLRKWRRFFLPSFWAWGTFAV